MSSITNIPLDMIKRAILVRLPVECLIRARAVSKAWRAVIDDPCFVRSHTNNLKQQLSSNIIIQKRTLISSISYKKLMKYKPTKKFGGSCYSLDLEALIGCISGHQAITATPLDLDVISDSDGPASFSSCNGLVLTKKPFTMWNPLTHERLDLPPTGYKKNVQAFGLGYDDTTDDYKAVAILYGQSTHVYSLKSDSWRSIINCPCDGDLRGPDGPGVFVCGTLNWLSEGEGGEYDVKILALDLRTEKYSLLQIPSSEKLIVLGGRLAVCDYRNKSHLDAWVMKVYGDEDSWFKLFSIENEQNNISMWRGYLRPSAFTMNEKLVFLQDDDRRFFLFDVETKSLKWVEINGSIINEDSRVFAQQMFVGTIFRLKANCGGGGSNELY